MADEGARPLIGKEDLLESRAGKGLMSAEAAVYETRNILKADLLGEEEIDGGLVGGGDDGRVGPTLFDSSEGESKAGEELFLEGLEGEAAGGE